MIRRVYLDFIKEKIASGRLGWILEKACQYSLTHVSYLARRPLCGPLLATFIATYRCNFSCAMCNLPQREGQMEQAGRRELSTAELKALLGELARLGAAGIGFTGGEPLLREDIFELLAHSAELGMITHLNTNGSLLEARNIQRLLDSRVDSVNISLDGAKAQTHDSIRGSSGAYEKATAAVRGLVAARGKRTTRPRVKVVAVLGMANIDEALELVRLAQDLGTDCIEFIPEQPFGKSPQYPADFPVKAESLARRLSGLKRQGVPIENSFRHLRLFGRSFLGVPSPLCCYAGYNSCAVDCYGRVYPCMPWVNWGKAVSDLAVDGLDLKRFWYSSEYNRIRRDIAGCRSCYLNCQAELNLLFNASA